ncbi:LacI family transcriptional regulator [Devosia limi DSM 17137]|uniref:LacI family transcriptional regulator n=1 Tax=Devosia limi DSM 17137 TaxID=1121477 RepID=A0A0F5LUB1_9HYPH|nr:LacI family DNA-binding transcriptional regulator [Devosia limi]KKB85928.1 LacI family transcriptional regulator [Devosia limi DSM 17137]SHF01645.1 transcriptional regulator, LacI family [Devosia limi DSM 17137]
MTASKRLTQRDIARLAGVSQATVSLVLNDASSAEGRIPQETRERVHKAIRDTGYVADPIARRMAKGLNRILGVFTYEPAFPVEQADFFGPFLFGIEEAAQQMGYDLLLLTGAAHGAQRKIFSENNRLRLADGCLVLGRQFDQDELARLVGGDYPFVAVGRRDDAGGPVPYVGGDYATATAALVQRARELGHHRIAYVGPAQGAESTVDRWVGFSSAIAGMDFVAHVPAAAQPAAQTLDTLIASKASVVFFIELADAIQVEQLALQRGISIPGDLSIVVLGNHIRAEQTITRFTSFSIPREAMGHSAARMLVRRVESQEPTQQVLLPCEPVEGETLGAMTHRTK